jgi:tRNA threonylcarbamoyladenosine biosynthesis protein TsaE
MTGMRFPAEIESASEEETRAAGRALGAILHAGDVVALSGSLGSGKTVFVRGIAEGLGGDPEDVTSPTFALLHEYDCARAGTLVHLDLYRVADEERELVELGLPDLLEGKVAAVEWPGATAARLLRFRYRVALDAAEPARRRIRIDETTAAVP